MAALEAVVAATILAGLLFLIFGSARAVAKIFALKLIVDLATVVFSESTSGKAHASLRLLTLELVTISGGLFFLLLLSMSGQRGGGSEL